MSLSLSLTHRRPPYLRVAAGPRGAGGVHSQHAGVGVAAGVVAELRRPAVALLPALYHAVAAARTRVNLRRDVLQAVEAGTGEALSEVLLAAGTPTHAGVVGAAVGGKGGSWVSGTNWMSD